MLVLHSKHIVPLYVHPSHQDVQCLTLVLEPMRSFHFKGLIIHNTSLTNDIVNVYVTLRV